MLTVITYLKSSSYDYLNLEPVNNVQTPIIIYRYSRMMRAYDNDPANKKQEKKR